MSEKIKINGWVEEIRDLGGIKFIDLHTPQGNHQITLIKNKVPEDLFKLTAKITRQSAITVWGEEKENKEAPSGKEIIPEKIEVLSLSQTPLPLDPSGKTPAELDTRLDWRSLDLRNNRNTSIFKIQSKIVQGMQEWLSKEGFIQVFTPCIMGAASEGGSEVFPVLYFDKEAFLRQDPQLHRELVIAGGFNKVYDLGPNWRAEKSHTPRHLCEHRGCAVELSFIKDERDTMRVEEGLVASAFKRVKEDCERELKLLGVELEIPKTPFPELKFPDIYKILEKLGKKIPFGEDYDSESEKLLGEYVKEKYKSDFFFVNRFPFKKKPFYVMKVENDPQWARSVDMIYRGVEQSSGGQREHRYGKLIDQVKEKGMKPESVEWFTKFFKYGCPPLGGFCIGIERLTMQMLDIKNVREVTLFPRTPERLMP